MNKNIKNILVASVLSASAAYAGVPLNNLQGVGGIAFNPLAYTAGQPWEGGETNVFNGIVSKPQVGGWYVNLSDSDINWFAIGTAITFAERLEVSYGYGFTDAKKYGDKSIDSNNLGAKLRILDENAFDTQWVPAIAVGSVYKHTNTDLAGAHGLAVANKADSQDFYSGEKDELIGAPPKAGEIVDLAGRVLGRHAGYWNFTIGQRKRLGAFGPDPLYVVRLDACYNRVVVGRRAEAFVKAFTVADLHWMAQAPTEAPFSALVKVRSTGDPLGPVVFEKGTCRVEGEGLFGVAPGQSAVFYDKTGTIRCGGVIA